MDRYEELMRLIPNLKASFTLLEVEDLRSHQQIMRACKPYKDFKRHHYSVTLSIGKESYTSKYYGPVDYQCYPFEERYREKPIKGKSELEKDLLVSFMWCFMLDSHYLESEGLKDALDLMKWGEYEKPNEARKVYSALRDAEDGWQRLGLNKYRKQLEVIYEDY